MKDINTILSEQVEHFLFSIKAIADSGKLNPLKSRFGGFPIFVKDMNLFYEQVNLEERIMVRNVHSFYLHRVIITILRKRLQ